MQREVTFRPYGPLGLDKKLPKPALKKPSGGAAPGTMGNQILGGCLGPALPALDFRSRPCRAI